MFSGERANLTIHRQGKSASSGPVSRSGNSSPPWLHPAQSLRAAPVGSQLLRGVTASPRGKAQLHGGGSGRTVSWVPGPTPFSNIALLSDAAPAPAPAPGDSPWPPGACPRPRPRLSSQASLPHLRRLSILSSTLQPGLVQRPWEGLPRHVSLVARGSALGDFAGRPRVFKGLSWAPQTVGKRSQQPLGTWPPAPHCPHSGPASFGREPAEVAEICFPHQGSNDLGESYCGHFLLDTLTKYPQFYSRQPRNFHLFRTYN